MKKGDRKRRDMQAFIRSGLCTNESQSEKKCKEFFVLPSESRMVLRFAISEVVFLLVMDWVLHAVPD